MTRFAQRIPYDLDGTQGFWSFNNELWDMGPAHLRALNAERGPALVQPTAASGEGNLPVSYGARDVLVSGTHFGVLIFPEEVDIDGLYMICYNPDYTQDGDVGSYRNHYTWPWVVEASRDTTNGLDGTWNVIAEANSSDYFSDTWPYQTDENFVFDPTDLSSFMDRPFTWDPPFPMDNGGFQIRTKGLHQHSARVYLQESPPNNWRAFGSGKEAVYDNPVPRPGTLTETFQKEVWLGDVTEYQKSALGNVSGVNPVGGRNSRAVRALRLWPSTNPYNGIRGLRQQGSTMRFHVYGHVRSHRLAFVSAADPASGVDPAWQSWETGHSGSVQTKTVRVRNLSTLRKALGVTLTVSAPLGGDSLTPTTDQIRVSVDGGASWSSTVSIGSLAPGAYSGEIAVRWTVPTTPELGAWSPRLELSVTGWEE